jgi:hypothetical protein
LNGQKTGSTKKIRKKEKEKRESGQHNFEVARYLVNETGGANCPGPKVFQGKNPLSDKNEFDSKETIYSK